MNINQFFDFTSGQLRILALLTASAIIMGCYILIKAYSTPTSTAISLPVFLSAEERTLTGVFVLDPNTAPADSLELLPGIGRTLADRVVAYRVENPFEREVEITEVKGIGPKLFESIKPYLKVKR
ncbi:MAG: helix-hairpin-helix domain-containing protein [candidate division Zixibacteria bacterium]|nr:helix-hairpin-helix domain-containing protein [candidate division Zixibacteria bacterium]